MIRGKVEEAKKYVKTLEILGAGHIDNFIQE